MRTEPQTVGDIMKANHLLPKDLSKVRRHFYYADIFRLYEVLKHPKLSAKHFHNNLFDTLLTYRDLDLLIAHRDALMVQCVERNIPRHIILGI